MSEENCFTSWYAAKMGKTKRMERLLRRDGFDLNERNEQGRTPLHFACKFGRNFSADRFFGVLVSKKDFFELRRFSKNTHEDIFGSETKNF